MIKTVDRVDWLTLDEWKRSWYTWQIEFFGRGIDNTFEFKRIGPFVVGGAYWLRDEGGKRYLSSPREVASSTWGIGYPPEKPHHLS